MTDVTIRNMINICTKYIFDIFIFTGSYGEHRHHNKIEDGQMPGHRTLITWWVPS